MHALLIYVSILRNWCWMFFRIGACGHIVNYLYERREKGVLSFLVTNNIMFQHLFFFFARFFNFWKSCLSMCSTSVPFSLIILLRSLSRFVSFRLLKELAFSEHALSKKVGLSPACNIKGDLFLFYSSVDLCLIHFGTRLQKYGQVSQLTVIWIAL